MLTTVPPEILTHIAYHLALPSLSPPVPLLQSCKAIHQTLSSSNNPRLYARIFRTAFDVKAAERRIGDIHAGDVAQELRRRVETLRRLGMMTRRGEVEDTKAMDLWIIYIMLIENDGKNIQHFVGRNAVLPLNRFLKLYQENVLLPAGLEPGYPAETVERSLFMWIAWFLAGYESTSSTGEEPAHERDERLFVLRPYVFAPQQYELCFAPWTIADLPLTEPPAPIDSSNPFIADLTPKSRLTTVKLYGSTIQISAPVLSHAAILLFFVKRRGVRRDASSDVPLPIVALGHAGDGTDDLEDYELPHLAANAAGDQMSSAGADPEAEATSGTAALIAAAQAQAVAAAIAAAAHGKDDDEEDGDDTFGAIRDLVSNSANHDRDFARLRACYDPFSCRGMPRSTWRGSFEGCWEGNFSFFDFDAFREMLAGQSRALYEGPFGEQAQVWRLTETWVWRKTWGTNKKRQRQREKEERDRKRQEAIDAGEEVEEEHDADKGKGKARGLPLTGPATNAGFPTNLPSSTSAGLASRAAEQITLRETIKQQVDALQGYEMVPDDELEEALSEDDGGEEAGLEMILTGVGHSAWGRFILKGKVRAWDGMASLVKEYAPDSRGKWIYRGYVVSGDIFVGRWRDTFTPEAYVGYEGTFILNRR